MRLVLGFLFVSIFYFGVKADTLTISMDTIVGVEDSQVEVSVTAEGFTELAVFEGTIQWDSLGLDFIEVRDFGVENLRSENFGRPNGTVDKLTFSWTEASADGQSVPDGTVLFKILFDVIGSGGDTAVVNFADNPLDVTAADKSLADVFVLENHGAVIILSPLGVSADVVDVTCFGGSDGSISLTASGANGEYSFLWNTGSDSSAITNLETGTYEFTLTDDVNGQEITNSINLLSPDEIVIDIQDVTAEGDTLGSITYDATGGIGPYSFVLSPAIMPDQGLENGIYTVMVTDENNCTAIDSIEINIQLPSSLTEVTIPTISVYPNPTSDQVTVELDANLQTRNWALFSSLGQKVSDGIIDHNQGQFLVSLGGNTTGFYYLRIENQSIPILLVK